MLANEPDLIQRAQVGDGDAFSQLILYYQDMVYRLALKTVQDPEIAADATQDTFLRAFLAIHTVYDGCFQQWLTRILLNRCGDLLRRQRHQVIENLSTPIKQADYDQSLEQHAEQIALQQVIAAAIQALAANQRLLVILFEIQGHDYAEIAEMTGWPMGTVKSRLFRARGQLRDFLLEYWELLPDFCLTAESRKLNSRKRFAPLNPSYCNREARKTSNLDSMTQVSNSETFAPTIETSSNQSHAKV